MAPTTFLLGACLALTAAAVPAPIIPRQSDERISFKDIEASTDLKWTNCGAKPFQCAKLTVPNDYTNQSAGTIDIAYIRYLVSEDNEDIIYNPGGPGGSGVDGLQGSAESWAKRWLGYNFVSFDPRGVARSEPILDCKFAKDGKRSLYQVGDLREKYDEAVQRNKDCHDNTRDESQYTGTVANVQDMMHFTELQASLRKKDAKKALINYYGVSYGTLMGQTLVAMYPDRLRRVLLSGNVYGVAHYQGWEPSGSDDYGHGVWLYAKACFEAGPELCSLADGQNSIEDVKTVIDYIVDSLRAAPGKSVADGSPYTVETLLEELNGPLMRPRSEYATIANITMKVLEGVYLQSKTNKRDLPLDEDEAARNKLWPANSQVTSIDAAGRFPWKSYDEWHAAVQRMDDGNTYGFGTFATSYGLFGVGQTVIPPKSQIFPGFKKIKPSTKVMFINTSGDPVTPTASCRQMSKMFDGSGVVIVEGPGHGYEAAPSKCAYNYVDNYWKNGTVPDQEVTCQMDVTADYFFGGPAPDWLEALS